MTNDDLKKKLEEYRKEAECLASDEFKLSCHECRAPFSVAGHAQKDVILINQLLEALDRIEELRDGLQEASLEIDSLKSELISSVGFANMRSQVGREMIVREVSARQNNARALLSKKLSWEKTNDPR